MARRTNAELLEENRTLKKALEDRVKELEARLTLNFQAQKAEYEKVLKTELEDLKTKLLNKETEGNKLKS